MGRFAEALQVLGATAGTIGMFAWLAWPVALIIVGSLAVMIGICLEIGTRPRQVAAPPRPPTAEERRAASLADLATHQSGR